MKFFKRLNEYKASNVIFKVEQKEAYSYNWWCFFKVINGKNVFNNYNYSPSTIKHQYKVMDLLEDLGIEIDLIVHTSKSLNDCEALEDAIKEYTFEIEQLEKAINKPRSQKKKNEKRREEIKELQQKIEAVKAL